MMHINNRVESDSAGNGAGENLYIIIIIMSNKIVFKPTMSIPQDQKPAWGIYLWRILNFYALNALII